VLIDSYSFPPLLDFCALVLRTTSSSRPDKLAYSDSFSEGNQAINEMQKLFHMCMKKLDNSLMQETKPPITNKLSTCLGTPTSSFLTLFLVSCRGKSISKHLKIGGHVKYNINKRPTEFQINASNSFFIIILELNSKVIYDKKVECSF